MIGLHACAPEEELVAACGPGAFCTIAGTGVAALGEDDVAATASHLYQPVDFTRGPDGRGYVVDFNNHRVREIDLDGTIRTVVGTGVDGNGGPEGPALEVSLNHPSHVAFDAGGALVLASWHNYRLDRVDLATGLLTHLAGTGDGGSRGNGGPALEAELLRPAAVAWDSRGNLFFSDTGNMMVRMIDADGNVQRAVGTGAPGFSGDGGPAIHAQLQYTGQGGGGVEGKIAVGGERLYIADTLNDRVRVVDMTTGLIDTLVEGLAYPTAVAVGPEGEVYVADTRNSCVRVVTDGTMETFAGTCGTAGYAGDGGPPGDALLDEPLGVYADDAGNVYVADSNNHRIRVAWRE